VSSELNASCTVRRATALDLTALAELVRDEVHAQRDLARCFELASDIDWREFVDAKLRDPDRAILVTEHEGKVVAYSELRLARRQRRPWILRLLRMKAPARVGIVEDIYVSPRLRLRYCGTNLLEEGLAWLKSHGVKRVVAGVWARNTRSLQFFGKREFTQRRVTLRREI
jgi:GNAT superfamily N-acetyltransferase